MDSGVLAIESVKSEVPIVERGLKAASARKAAQQFEAVMLSQSFQEMFKGVEGPKSAGAGQSEKIWQSLMIEEMAKSVAATNSIGIADKIYKEILD